MRWIWIDRFTKFEPGKSAQAVKNVSMAEEHLHDHFRGYPVMPASLIIEGMAQTAGILISQASGFKEKVVLAKISNASFQDVAVPGDVLLYTVNIEQINEQFTIAGGEALVITPKKSNGSGQPRQLATVELMFSHLDHNLSGKKFPEGNFILTDTFSDMLRNVLPAGGNEPADNPSE